MIISFGRLCINFKGKKVKSGRGQFCEEIKLKISNNEASDQVCSEVSMEQGILPLIQYICQNLFFLLEANYFAILYWFCHTLTWISHAFTCVPHPHHPSRLPPHPIPLGHPSAPAPSTCLMHPTWAGDPFHIWYYTCVNATLPNHPTLALSHRVQKTVLYICVSFSVLHIGLLLPSF